MFIFHNLTRTILLPFIGLLLLLKGPKKSAARFYSCNLSPYAEIAAQTNSGPESSEELGWLHRL